MGKGIDTGKAFYQGLLSKIADPEQRAAAEKLLGNETFLTELGNGVEGQQGIDRTLQTLSAQKAELDTQKGQLDARQAELDGWHGQLTDWYGENKTLLDQARGKGTGNGNPEGVKKVDGTEDPTKVPLTLDQHNALMQQERAAILGYDRDKSAIQRDFFAKFNEFLDLEPLLAHPQIARVGLKGVYDLVHKDRLEKWATDQQTAHDDKIRAEAVKAYQQTQSQMPYPVPSGAGSGSPLDALEAKKPEPLVDAATAHYLRIVAEREGGVARP